MTGTITELGRTVDDLPATDPDVRKFWMLHGVYSGLDILKIAVGFAFALRLAFRRKPDNELFAREYASASFADAKLDPQGKLKPRGKLKRG